MALKLAYIHTVPALVGLFSELSKEMLPPEVEIYHIADEILLKTVLAQGGLSPFIYRRVAEHAAAAGEAGASLVQLTCSSISPCAEAAAALAGIPVLKIDEPMVDCALSLGKRIGIAATAPTTLKPTTELVHARARYFGKEVSVEAVLCAGAYAALFSGDAAEHDRIVRWHLQDLMARCDVVILAQASMARVADAIPLAEQGAPVLSSPSLAVQRLAEALRELEAGAQA
jgi:Asp/Glu/hydantoin racemase